jgi:hypothetical protein
MRQIVCRYGRSWSRNAVMGKYFPQDAAERGRESTITRSLLMPYRA